MLGAIVLLSLCLTGHAQTNDWSKRIVSKIERPVASYINPHISPVNVLIIDGKRFEHVRGFKTFYLPAPQINAVVFVVDEKDYSITYHVLKMDTGEDIAVHARSSSFGHTIGFSPTQDSIESVEDSKLVLCMWDKNAKSTLASLTNLASIKSLYYLDLSKKTIAENTLYLDKDGKTIR